MGNLVPGLLSVFQCFSTCNVVKLNLGISLEGWVALANSSYILYIYVHYIGLTSAPLTKLWVWSDNYAADNAWNVAVDIRQSV